MTLSGDGLALGVGAAGEDSAAMGVGGAGADDAADEAGAAYLFVRDELEPWSQQAYLKAANSGAGDGFGRSLALSQLGDALIVGAPGEDSSASGVDGDPGDNAAEDAGAAYVLGRDQAQVVDGLTVDAKALGPRLEMR